MSPPVTQAIILAAGEGRRLRPVTAATPKPLVPFFGRPLLAWAIARLARAGVTRVAINAHHRADALEAYLARQRFPLEVHLRREPTLLGTGGAIRNLRDWLRPGTPFYVLNADAVFAASPLTLTHPASMLVTRAPNYRQLRHMVATPDLKLGALDASSPQDGYTFCGLTLADPELPQRLPDGPSCVLRHGFAPYLAELPVTLVETRAFFADTGTPSRLVDAHLRGAAWASSYDPRELGLPRELIRPGFSR